VTEALFPFGETIVQLIPGEKLDPYSGKLQDDWSHPTEVKIAGCAAFPAAAGATETAAPGRPQRAVETLTVLLPPGVVIAPTDRVRRRGVEFNVLGFSNQFESPFTGWKPGGVVTIQRVVG